MKYFIHVFAIMIVVIVEFIQFAQAETPKILYLPTNDAAVYVQQGWIYDYSTANHCGIDYRKGTVGQWDTFNVNAVYDGEYTCSWSDSWGWYIKGEYATSTHTYYSIYAHLDSCEFNSGYFNAGEYLGLAGMTGNANNYIHLHFEIGVDSYGQSGCSENVDPYDLYTTQDYYPDTYNEDGSCGADNLWTQCPPVIADSFSSLFSTALTTDFSEYNKYNQRKISAGVKEHPEHCFTAEKSTLHWWGYADASVPTKSNHIHISGANKKLSL